MEGEEDVDKRMIMMMRMMLIIKMRKVFIK